MKEQEMIEQAKKKVKDKKDFYEEVAIFCAVSFMLFLFNYFTSPEFWWFLFAVAGWGIALLGKYVSLFGFPGFGDEKWEEKQFEIELEKLKRQQQLEGYKKRKIDILEEELELKEPVKIRKNYDSDELV